MPPKDDAEEEIDMTDGASVPDAPRDLDITDFDAESVTLKWKAPLIDGGNPINGYILQFRKMRGEESEWHSSEKIKPTKYPTGTIKDLETKTKYEFQVCAQNRVGRGPPSETTLPLTVRAQKAPPKIDRKALPETTSVKVNHQLVLEVPVEGAPPPNTSWWCKDSQVLTSETVKVTNNPNQTKLLFIPTIRSLSGVYTLKAINEYGEDSVEVNIDIYGPSKAPTGPLKVSEITKRKCLLQWGFPADDGGRQITHFEIEKKDLINEDANWLPCGTAKGLSYTVANMVEGHRYHFRVKAINSDGFESPELKTEEEVLAKNPFDPPSTPEKPTLVDWGENFADLSWTEPKEDGGSEIVDYRIEVRNRNKRSWILGETTKSTSGSITSSTGLITPGNDYQFRIIAVNKGGEVSEASKSSDPITAQVRFIKPKIDRDMLIKEKNIHVGQTLRLEALVTSMPLASICWYYPNGSKISLSENDDKISIEINEYGVASLSIDNISRAECGNFKLIATNSEGSDEIEIRVDVVGVPSHPIGPLEVTNVTTSSCKLSWKRPEDTGGSPIIGYLLERRDSDKEAWISCGKETNKTVIILRELEYDVKGLIEGRIYFFRAICINAHGESDPLESKIPICAKSEIDSPEPPFSVTVVDWDKKWVILEWSCLNLDTIKHFIIEAQEHFRVPKDLESKKDKKKKKKSKKKKKKHSSDDEEDDEESSSSEDSMNETAPTDELESNRILFKKKEFEDYCTQWMRVMTTEDNSTEAKVTDLSEGTKYNFRVRALNAGGVSLPSDSSNEIVCKVRKQCPTIDRGTVPSKIFVSNGENIVMSIKVKGEPAPKKSWYYGGRLEIKESTSVDITDKDYSSKIILFGGRKDDTGTYIFKASNEHGEDSVEIPVVVMAEPSKPRGPLKISNVTAEGCKAEWSEPEDDGGSSITYYIIEKINKSHSQWNPCGRTTDTSVQISGLCEGKDYHIRVRAVNNEGESEPLEGVDSFFTENPWGPPSYPGKPILNDYDFDFFEIKWDPPKHDGGSRITGYQMQIRPWKCSDWEFIENDIKGQIERGTISSGLKIGQVYTARVRAVNVGGTSPWSIESEPLTVKYKSLKPKIKLNTSLPIEDGEVIVKADHCLVVGADILAEPPSEDIVWTLGSKTLIDDSLSSVIIENSKPYKSILQKSKMTRRDCGFLTCMATNVYGKDAAKIKIKIIDVPSIPNGVLEVSKIHKSGCRLHWEKPTDNGGLPIEYIVEKFIVAADTWTTQGTTSATFMDINDLETGREYNFCVKAVNKIGESEDLTLSKPILAKNQYTIPLSPGAPSVVDWSERHMDIKWEDPIDDGGAPIYGYHVEARSKDTEDEWQLWETVDTNTCEAKIQKLRLGVFYQFRVIAINRAGKSQPSHPSRSQEAKPRNLIPYIDAKSLRDITVEVGERVKFDLPIIGEPQPEIQWYHEQTETVLSSRPDKSLIISNDEGSSKIIFNSVTREDAGTYVLTIINDSGKDYTKFQLKVLDRPDGPDGLSASVLFEEDGSSPKVSLVWKKTKYDGGSPVDYYQVERFNPEKQSWIACGRSKENTLDVKGLFSRGESYKFKVAAVNKLGESDPISESILIPDGSDDSNVRNLT